MNSRGRIQFRLDAKLMILLVILIETSVCYEYDPFLGQQYIQFPTSTKNTLAQQHFILGVAHLHSFGYSFAFEEFVRAYTIDSSFAMAYVFSSLTKILPVWLEEYPTEGWEQIKLMDANIHFDNLTQREQFYVLAARKLFDGGIMHYDDYTNALKELFGLFPKDNEAGALLVCILFVKTQPEIRGYANRNPEDRQLQIKTLNQILKTNPNHPGALHYFTHTYDQPDTALLALPNAIKYSRVAPSSPHAQHMSTHIYLRLGLYQEALIGNLESVLVGMNNQPQYHSIEFLHYIYLNMGRRSIALQLLENLKPLVINGSFYKMQYGLMYDRHIVETQDYHFAFDNPLDLLVCPDCQSTGDRYWLYQINSGLLLVKGFSTVKNNQQYNSTQVQQYIQQLSNMSIELNQTEPTLSTSILAMKFQLEAFHQYYRLAKTNDEKNLALKCAQMASELEVSVNPPSYGPPIDPVKPSQELYGELLLENEQYQEAIEQFSNVMNYFPNRTLTLLGLARANAQLNKTDSARFYYSRLMNDMLYNADFGYPWYDEAVDYLATHFEERSHLTSCRIMVPIAFGLVVIVTFVLGLLIRKSSRRKPNRSNKVNNEKTFLSN